MKKRILYFVCFSLLGLIAHSQSIFNYETITDERDSKTYRTIELNNTVWLAENMKYQTTHSENHELNNIELDGYYYPMEEIDEVCPIGFRIPLASVSGKNTSCI